MTQLENLLGYRGTFAEPVRVLGRPCAHVEQHREAKDLWWPWNERLSTHRGTTLSVLLTASRSTQLPRQKDLQKYMVDGRVMKTSRTANLGWRPSGTYSLARTYHTGHTTETWGHAAASGRLWSPQWLSIFCWQGSPRGDSRQKQKSKCCWQ